MVLTSTNGATFWVTCEATVPSAISLATQWSRLQVMRRLAKSAAPPQEAIHDEYLASPIESTVNIVDFYYMNYLPLFHGVVAIVVLCELVVMHCVSRDVCRWM